MILSLFFNAGLGLLTSSAIASGALKSEMTTAKKAESKVELVNTKPVEAKPVSAEVSIPVSIPTNRKLKMDKHGMPTYPDSQARRYVRTTSYCHLEDSYGGKNAIGTRLVHTKKKRSAAADWSVYPVGTKFKIKGESQIYEIDDYGSALVGTNTIDIYKPTMKMMHKRGTRKVQITVIEWGCYERSQKILKARRAYKHCRKMYNAIKKKLESSSYAQL